MKRAIVYLFVLIAGVISFGCSNSAGDSKPTTSYSSPSNSALESTSNTRQFKLANSQTSANGYCSVSDNNGTHYYKAYIGQTQVSCTDQMIDSTNSLASVHSNGITEIKYYDNLGNGTSADPVTVTIISSTRFSLSGSATITEYGDTVSITYNNIELEVDSTNTDIVTPISGSMSYYISFTDEYGSIVIDCIYEFLPNSQARITGTINQDGNISTFTEIITVDYSSLE